MKKLKSYCLHEDITGKVTMQEPDNGEDGLYYNANDVDAVIEQQHREIEELKRDRDGWKHDRDVCNKAFEDCSKQCDELVDENQALAAHVERIEDEITGIINDSVGISGYHMNGDIASWQEFDIENILEQTPENSLAEVRAQAVEEYKRSITEPNAIVHTYPVVDLSGFYLPPANGAPTFMYGNIEKAESGSPKAFVKCVIGRLLELLEEMEAADGRIIRQKGE